MKKGLVFGLIAVLSAALLVTACDNGTSGTETQAAVTPDGVVVDRTVDSTTSLISALADNTVDVVAYILSSDVSSGNIIIPAGKTVYLLNSTTDPKSFGPAELEVRGTLIVSESTVLAAGANNRVYLGNSGSIQIQAGGELRTDVRLSVSDLTDTGTAVASAIGKVRYAGGSVLTVTAEPGLTVEEIGTLLGYLPASGAARSAVGITGRTSTLTLTAPLTAVKPSDFAGVGEINAKRALTVTTQLPETREALTIPAGLSLTTAAGDLGVVTSLTVEGALSADTLPKLTSLTVSAGGGFTASGAVGAPEGLTTVAIAGTVTVQTLNVAASAAVEVAAGGSFDGDAGAAAISAAEGAKVNGTTVTDAGAKIVVLTAATATLPTTEAGTTYQIKGAVTIGATFTVVEGATLLIPAGASLTVDDKSGSIAGDGKVVVEEGGAATGVPALDPTANYNPEGLKITRAEKNLKTGGLTVTLGGAVSNGITDTAKTNFWGNGGSNKPAGNWSWATIVNFINTDAAAQNTVIKQTSQALRYYQGSANDVLATEPDPANPPTTGAANIYIDSAKAYKLKKYTTALTATESFGVLLWSGASPKTATFEIIPAAAITTNPATASAYTVIVDWSGVTFN
jgi:hypothetical protein